MNSEIQIGILPVWTDNFLAELLSAAESHWLYPKRLTWNSYSTERYLDNGAKENSSNRASCNWFERVENCQLHATELLRRLGLQPATFSDAERTEAQTTMRHVDELLRNVSCVRQSVNIFVRSLHLIDSHGPDYDCSFSDPSIPFSIFVSVPASQGKNRVLRVFEAMVHESMHLQLSAWELLHPVVQTNSDEATWYSPWKKTHRKLQGVLHGMYVFHVIAHAYSELLGRGVLSSVDKSYAVARLTEIKSELEQVHGVQSSPAFTDGGARLTAAILNRAKKPSLQNTNVVCEQGVRLC